MPSFQPQYTFKEESDTTQLWLYCKVIKEPTFVMVLVNFPNIIELMCHYQNGKLHFTYAASNTENLH